MRGYLADVGTIFPTETRHTTIFKLQNATLKKSRESLLKTELECRKEQ